MENHCTDFNDVHVLQAHWPADGLAIDFRFDPATDAADVVVLRGLADSRGRITGQERKKTTDDNIAPVRSADGNHAFCQVESTVPTGQKGHVGWCFGDFGNVSAFGQHPSIDFRVHEHGMIRTRIAGQAGGF